MSTVIKCTKEVEEDGNGITKATFIGTVFEEMQHSEVPYVNGREMCNCDPD